MILFMKIVYYFFKSNYFLNYSIIKISQSMQKINKKLINQNIGGMFLQSLANYQKCNFFIKIITIFIVCCRFSYYNNILAGQMIDETYVNIQYNYQRKEKKMLGGQGIVQKWKNKKNRENSILKKKSDAFHTSQKTQKVYRQINNFDKFHHSKIASIIAYHIPPNTNNLYIQSQQIPKNLLQSIQQNRLIQIHKNFIFYQMANAVRYLHSNQLIHRDIRPSNIFINQFCLIKLSGLELIRSTSQIEKDQEIDLREIMANRQYRSPQVLINKNIYGKQNDIWGLGCVLAELFLKKPIFGGQSTISQLQRIFQVIGKPKRQQLDFLQNKTYQKIIQSMVIQEQKPIKGLFEKQDTFLIDLLQKIFVFDPRKRIKIQEIMIHPFLSDFKGNSGENCNKKSHLKVVSETQLQPKHFDRHLLKEFQDEYFNLKTCSSQNILSFSETKQIQLKNSIIDDLTEMINIIQIHSSNKKKTEIKSYGQKKTVLKNNINRIYKYVPKFISDRKSKINYHKITKSNQYSSCNKLISHFQRSKKFYLFETTDIQRQILTQ